MGHQHQISTNIIQGRLRASLRLFRRLPFLLLIGALFFYSERPSWGAGYHVDVNSEGISGFASNMPLGEVLDDLAEKGGYTVFIDEKLLSSPTTFDLPAALPAEKAIQRMVHPHSYAMVYTKLPGRQELAVDQIKVYAKGTQSASYVRVVGETASSSHIMSSDSSGAPVMSHTGGSSSRIQSGLQAVRRQVKPPVVTTKSALGSSGFQYKDRRRGPDYRRNTMAMAQGYTQYREEREALEFRSKDAQFQTVKQASETRKNAYRSQRSESIKITINNASF